MKIYFATALFITHKKKIRNTFIQISHIEFKTKQLLTKKLHGLCFHVNCIFTVWL